MIVSNLKGTGEKPAIAKRVIHAITPPSEDTLSFKNEAYPIKYPRQAPKTDPIVAIDPILIHSYFRAIVMGIIKTSGGRGNIKLSIKDINPKIDLDLL